MTRRRTEAPVKAAKKPKKKTATQQVKEEVREREAGKKKKADEKFLHLMGAQARKINAHMTKALTADGKADDHRLSAALEIASTEHQFQEQKPKDVSFKAWCEASEFVVAGEIGRSWENVRKLLKCGQSDDPKLFLEGIRTKNVTANKKLRDKKTATVKLTPFEVFKKFMEDGAFTQTELEEILAIVDGVLYPETPAPEAVSSEDEPETDVEAAAEDEAEAEQSV